MQSPCAAARPEKHPQCVISPNAQKNAVSWSFPAVCRNYVPEANYIRNVSVDRLLVHSLLTQRLPAPRSGTNTEQFFPGLCTSDYPLHRNLCVEICLQQTHVEGVEYRHGRDCWKSNLAGDVLRAALLGCTCGGTVDLCPQHARTHARTIHM